MDQRPIGERQDYLRFQTPVLERDVVIAGPVSMELWASTDGPDTDFMVKLVDVYPDGYEAIVLDSALRTRYRHGRHRDEVAMMTPGRAGEADARPLGHGDHLREGPPDRGARDQLELAPVRHQPEHRRAARARRRHARRPQRHLLRRRPPERHCACRSSIPRTRPGRRFAR